MENQDIRIITLPPLRVASFYAFCKNPETEAWDKVYKWANSHGVWQDAPMVRIFGFNNPNPSEGSPNYGYEFWLTIGTEVITDGETKIKDFSGGLYAVLFCDVSGNPWDIIPATWGKLVKWLESSHYKHSNHQWLEEHLSRTNPNKSGFLLDLYLPISE